MFYQYCNDCGCKKDFNTFRNCRSCMQDVKRYVYFDRCKRCGNPKRKCIEGLCKKCSNEIISLNNECRK